VTKRYVNEGGYVVPEHSSPGLTGQLMPRDELSDLQEAYRACINTLRDIAALGKGKGYEMAKHRLAQLGEPADG
jgi:hypothetical protein